MFGCGALATVGLVEGGRRADKGRAGVARPEPQPSFSSSRSIDFIRITRRVHCEQRLPGHRRLIVVVNPAGPV